MAKDAVFCDKMVSILNRPPWKRNQGGPTRLLDHLYIGDYKDAHNVTLLRQLGVTHVLTCYDNQRDQSPYPADSGITGYMTIPAEDRPDYDITQHFPQAIAFISDARGRGGKVFVHCARGINRSGAICGAYVMTYTGMDLLRTTEFLKERRNVILMNSGFRRQLVVYARQQGMLEPPLF